MIKYIVTAFLDRLPWRRCRSTASIPAVRNLALERYVGAWYEIARLPHPFEDGMSHTTTAYAIYPDRTISITNRGYLDAEQRWVEAHGAARLVNTPSVGELEVTFYRPFLSKYRIIALDPDYRYAMVTSARINRLWLLGRQPQLDEATALRLVQQAEHWGFDVKKLIWVDHQNPPEDPDQSSGSGSR